MCLAIPGRIVELLPDSATGALVDVVGVRRKIDLGLLADDPPVVGDWVLIHVGFAMSKISEADARDQMEMLRMLGEQDAALTEVTGYGLDDEALDEPPGGPPGTMSEEPRRVAATSEEERGGRR
jgi:hydrogenase expression/formation protein HypC